MSFHSSPGHFQLTCNFGVVTALQKQFDDLLFAWAQPNSLFLHRFPLFFGICTAYAPKIGRAESFQFHSIHIAIFDQKPSVTLEHHFPQALAGAEAVLGEGQTTSKELTRQASAATGAPKR